MASSGEVDPLFDIRTAFYIGNYQQCINESQKLKVQGDVKTEKDIIMYRAFLAQKKYSVILSEISVSDPKLGSIHMFAEYLSNQNARERILKDLDVSLSKNIDPSNSIFLLMAASILTNEGNQDGALKVLHSSDSLECLALSIQILLRMDRADYARKELKRMQEIDEDNILTQLATSWINIYTGGDKLQDAYYSFQELADKFASTPLLLNGQASCHMMQGRYEDAESILQEAIDKDSNNAETLVNLIVLTQHLGKPVEITNRYISQLQESHKNHPIVRDAAMKVNEFNRLCSNYSASVSA